MHAAADDATTRYIRVEVDTDHTIPVELYTRPYDQIEIDETPAPTPVPASSSRGLVGALCIIAFVTGFGLVLLLGCKGASKEPPPPMPSQPTTMKADQMTGDNETATSQVRFSNGGEAPTDEGRIGFTITAVHAGQKPSTTAPFYEPGGEWTYVEAHLDGDRAATFIVGVPKFAATNDGPGFGKLMFAPTTRVAGANVVTRLAKVLGTTAPPPVSGGVLQPVKMPIAVLGQGVKRLANGMGGKGGWTATKLFCSAGEIDAAELFFNISIEDKQGEFSEKDTDYNKDVVACLATLLRDGLAPPRTPANDPTLTAAGPRLELGKKLGARTMQRLALSPSRFLLIDERGTSAAVVELDMKTGATKDLFSTPDRIDNGVCDTSLAHCALKLSTPKEARNVFGNDPSRLVLLEGTTATPLEHGLETPWLPTNAVSPDGRFVVAESFRPKKLVAFDRTTKKTLQLAGTSESIAVVAWQGTSAIVVHSSYEEKKPPSVVEWQLGAKGATKPSKYDRDAPEVSPDGKRSARFASGVLTLTAGDQKRTLAFNAADAGNIGPGCCVWLDNRWMAMPNGFIDTDAMKVSLLPPEGDEDQPRIDYLVNTRFALVSRGDGVYLATVVGP